MLRLLTLISTIMLVFVSCSSPDETHKPFITQEKLVADDEVATLPEPVFCELFEKRKLMDNLTLTATQGYGIINKGTLFLKTTEAKESKVILGFEQFNKVKLAEFQSIKFDSKIVNEGLTQNIKISLNVDLNCDDTNPAYQLIEYDNLVNHTGPLDQFVSYTVNASDISDIASALTTNPNACIVNGDLPGLMFVFGDSRAPANSKLFLDNIKITINNNVTNIQF